MWDIELSDDFALRKARIIAIVLNCALDLILLVLRSDLGRVWSHIEVVVVVSWQFKAQTVAFTTVWPVCLVGPAGCTGLEVKLGQNFGMFRKFENLASKKS